jgi:paraquat-inducible protein A
LRTIQFVRPWGMIEVFMLGVLVTLVKMVSIARVIPEAALFAFGALTLMVAVVVSFDPRSLWEVAARVEPSRDRRARKLRKARRARAHAPASMRQKS